MPALICGERFGNVTRTSWWLSECAATGIAAGQCNVKGPDSRRLVVPGGDRCWVGGGTERWDGDEGLWRPSCSALLQSTALSSTQLSSAGLSSQPCPSPVCCGFCPESFWCAGQWGGLRGSGTNTPSLASPAQTTSTRRRKAEGRGSYGK